MIPTIHDGRTIIFEEEGVLGSFKKQTHKAKPAVKKKIVQGPLRKKNSVRAFCQSGPVFDSKKGISQVTARPKKKIKHDLKHVQPKRLKSSPKNLPITSPPNNGSSQR